MPSQGLAGLLQMPEAFLVLKTFIQLAAKVPHAPSAKRKDDNAKLATPVGKSIGSAGWMIGIEFPAHQAVCFERFQPIRKNIRRHPRKAFLKVLKAHGAGKKVANNK